MSYLAEVIYAWVWDGVVKRNDILAKWYNPDSISESEL